MPHDGRSVELLLARDSFERALGNQHARLGLESPGLDGHREHDHSPAPPLGIGVLAENQQRLACRIPGQAFDLARTGESRATGDRIHDHLVCRLGGLEDPPLAGQEKNTRSDDLNVLEIAVKNSPMTAESESGGGHSCGGVDLPDHSSFVTVREESSIWSKRKAGDLNQLGRKLETASAGPLQIVMRKRSTRRWYDGVALSEHGIDSAEARQGNE